MKLTVLTENCAGRIFLAEHGLSYLIEHNGNKILFDTGHSDVFLHNAELLGINITQDIDTVVLSHGHWDHGDGLQFLQNKKLITHPKAFMNRYRRLDDTYLGLKMSMTEAMKRFDLVTSEKPIEIKPGIFYLGQIPRNNNFEAQNSPFHDGDKNIDYVMDDSGLAIVDGNEIVVITGCAHSGVCNMVEHAIKVTGKSKVRSVIGGFHLKKDDALTAQTIDYLEQLNIERLYPSHCTELAALTAFQRKFKTVQVKTGMAIEL